MDRSGFSLVTRQGFLSAPRRVASASCPPQRVAALVTRLEWIGASAIIEANTQSVNREMEVIAFVQHANVVQDERRTIERKG